jgi:hypothetical protein
MNNVLIDTWQGCDDPTGTWVPIIRGCHMVDMGHKSCFFKKKMFSCIFLLKKLYFILVYQLKIL